MKAKHRQIATAARADLSTYEHHRPRLMRKLLLFLLLLAVVVALLPTIVAKTPLRNMLIAAAVPSDAVRVTVGGASLGWLDGADAHRVGDPRFRRPARC